MMNAPIERRSLLLASALALGGCDREAKPSASEENPASKQAKPKADAKGGKAEVPSKEAWAKLTTQSLHDIPLPDPGHFRIEVEGNTYEGEMSLACGHMEASEEVPVDRFSAQGTWTTDDGKAMHFSLIRVVDGREIAWTRRGAGHESERVAIHVHDGGDEASVQMRDRVTAYGEVWLKRIRPGDDEIVAEYGSGEMPSIRVDEDRLRATAVATVGPDSDDGKAGLSGAVRLAVHCKPRPG
jgi:hypothetical protein